MFVQMAVVCLLCILAFRSPEIHGLLQTISVEISAAVLGRAIWEGIFYP
jgi:hypothetical protein